MSPIELGRRGPLGLVGHQPRHRDHAATPGPTPHHPAESHDVGALITAARDTDPALGTLPLLAVTTGARRGERCALRWIDLNPATGEVDIVRAVTIANGEAIGQ